MTKKLAVGLVLCAVLSLGAGCATLQGGRAEEQIEDLLAGWQAAFNAVDIEGLLSYYSEDFESPEYGDKNSFGEYMGSDEVRGFLAYLEFDLSKTETVIDGKTATVGPITIGADGQGYSINLDLGKAKGGWKIVRQSGGGGR